MLHWIQPFHQPRTSLRMVLDRIRSSLDLDVILQTTVQEVSTLLSLEGCLAGKLDPEYRQLRITHEQLKVSTVTTYLGNHALSQLGGLAPTIAQGKLAIRGQVIGVELLRMIAYWMSHLAPKQLSQQAILWGEKACILLPVRERTGGVIYLICLAEANRAWLTGEIELLQVLAQELEILIQQAHLHEQTQRQARREQLVNQITTQTRQSFELETILTEAIAQLLGALAADRCLVHLVEKRPLEVVSVSASDIDGCNSLAETAYGTAFRRKHLYEICRSPFLSSLDEFDTNGPITHWVIQTHQPVIIPDVTKDPRVGANNQEYLNAQIQSSLVMPVKANGNLHGILYINQCAYQRDWTDYDQDLAQAVADQLAISIQQAHLYAKTQQQAIESAEQAQYLAETLQALRQTQSRLIQSEKMSSLGQLVAGLAHEINNPISFIYGNLHHLHGYIRDLLRLLEAYQLEMPQPSAAIQAIIQEIELDFLQQDIGQVLASMNNGSERIRQIVLSLRSFSRLDESSRKVVNIHEGLDGAVMLLQYQLGDEIQIIRNYGDLPLIECYPKLLNQVFMGLLLNAVEALTPWPMLPKLITIQTQFLVDLVTGSQTVRVTIVDNGPGIPPEIQTRMFDPFFTTKPVGQGAGLGLAVSYQVIVQQHQGLLECRSQPGKGTEFVIELPVRYSWRTS